MRGIFLSALALLLSAGALAQAPAAGVPFSLDELQRRTFLYFWETADKDNVQVPDRYPTLTFSSVAATGFGLSSYLVGVERGWITREQAAERVLKTLEVLKNLPQGPQMAGVSGYKGFFYHFLDLKNAHRYQEVELSTIDSGLLLAGILSCQSYFDKNNATEKAIRETADFIYRRVEWTWMLNSNNRLSMGWHPERGFITAEWYGYNEAMILYILALGSPTHPIPRASWDAWCQTNYYDVFEGQPHVNFGPLFGHQYSHTWIDFNGIRDAYCRKTGLADYFQNSRGATLSNRAWCLRNAQKFPHYNDNIWGLTACDGPMDWLYKHDPERRCQEAWNGGFEAYNARGAATDYARDDGTVAPTAAGGSVPFAPEVCIPALQAMWETYYDSLVGPYGFKDAFNPAFTACGRLPNGWFDVDYLGIDQGPILLMIENYRSGMLWNIMKKNPYIVNGLRRAGFSGGWLDKSTTPSMPEPPAANMQPNPEVLTDPTAEFERHRFTAGPVKGGLPYRLFRPRVPGEKFPLVVFLHGSGERGSDNEQQLRNGVLGFLEGDRPQRFPAYVLAPQCPNEQRWAELDKTTRRFPEEPTGPMKNLMGLVKYMFLKYPDIDTSRVYVVGLSMGGYGVYDLLARRPNMFAAAVPLCAGGDPSAVERYKQVPMWIVHGRNDYTAPVDFSRKMVKALENAGAQPRYTEYTTLGHGIWQETFYNEELLKWLFSQTK